MSAFLYRFASVHRGTTWSIVLYSITAAAASREQHWREASQAFYRVSMVYSNMQATMCAGTTPSYHVFITFNHNHLSRGHILIPHQSHQITANYHVFICKGRSATAPSYHVFIASIPEQPNSAKIELTN